MISRERFLFYILCTAAVIVIMAGYYGSIAGKTETSSELPKSTRGIITGILYTQESPVAIIDGEILHEGDTVDNVKLVKIYADKVEFEINNKRWIQLVQEQPKSNWPEE